MNLPTRVGLSGLFVFVSGVKNDLENTINFQKKKKIVTFFLFLSFFSFFFFFFFAEKNFENILIYFQKISAKFIYFIIFGQSQVKPNSAKALN